MGIACTQETKAQLARIFKMIGGKTTTDEGIEALYRFQMANPSVDLAPHLAKTSVQFRQYIERGLQRVSAQTSGIMINKPQIKSCNVDQREFTFFSDVRIFEGLPTYHCSLSRLLSIERRGVVPRLRGNKAGSCATRSRSTR